jgi:hypothetical protein
MVRKATKKGRIKKIFALEKRLEIERKEFRNRINLKLIKQIESELDFLDGLGNFIYKKLNDKDSIRVRRLLFKRLKKLKKQIGTPIMQRR